MIFPKAMCDVKGKGKFNGDRPIILTGEQLKLLALKVSKFRHDVANDLTVLHTVAEITGRLHPDTAPRMNVILRNSEKINQTVRLFTFELEQLLGVRGELPENMGG